VDKDLNVFIADTINQRIRRVSAAGIITTVAGNGEAGFSGDGGPAILARLSSPRGVAADSKGNLYIADSANQRVRRVDAEGIITTVAGTGEPGLGGEGGPATEAQLAAPSGLAFDQFGNLLIALAGQGQLRAVTPGGTMQVIAGTRTAGFSGDGGPALAAQLSGVVGVAAGPDGSIYVTDQNNERLRKLEMVRIASNGVLNSASLAPGPVAPNELVLIRGLGIGPPEAVTGHPDEARKLPTMLGETRVLFDGVAVPLISVHERSVLAAVPSNAVESVRLQVEYNGRLTNEVRLDVAPSAPGIHVRGEEGQGPAAARNEDGADNTEAAPAMAGALLAFTVTGAGLTDVPLEDGQVTWDEFVRPALPVEVTIGGVATEIVVSYVPSGNPAGVVEFVVRVPSSFETFGALPIEVKIGESKSQPGVSVWVGPPA